MAAQVPTTLTASSLARVAVASPRSDRRPFLDDLRATVMRRITAALLDNATLCALIGRRRAASIDGRTLDPQIAALLALADILEDTEVHRLPPPVARARMLQQMRIVQAPPPPGVFTEEHWATGAGGPIPVRLYTPPGAGEVSPGMLYFQGGGFVTGSVDTHDTLCRRLAATLRIRVASVDYRLAPEHRFPAACEDALAAYRWFVDRAPTLGVDPQRVVVAGDSAGGNLAAGVALRARDEHPPVLQVLLYPWTDLTRSHASHQIFAEGYLFTRRLMDWYVENYIDEASTRCEEASPFFAADLRGAAPALVYTAGFDPLRDDGRAYTERLTEAMVRARCHEFPGLVHGFATMTGPVRAARRAVEQVCADIGAELGR